jgi:predicted P-loop ATPase
MNKLPPIVLSNTETQKKIPDITIEEYLNVARKLLENSHSDPDKKVQLIIDIAKELVKYNDPVKAQLYATKLAKEFKIKVSDFDLAVKQAINEKKELGQNKESSALVTRVELYISQRYQIYFNIIANKFMYKETGEKEFRELNLDNIYRELQKVHLKYSLSDIRSLLRSDFVEKKNVFFEYFENLPAWDGEDYIKKLSGYLQIREVAKNIDEKDRFLRMFRKMFVRSVACSLEFGANKQCFTLVGPSQNIGKSTFLRWLCPPALSDYISETIGTDKDELISLTENFIINIDELAVLSKYDINALKSVMEKPKVKVRLPYGERPEMLHRRCNFVASTNRVEFLNDETGSVRWICFYVEKINFEYNKHDSDKHIDINKVWSQAYHLFKNTKFDYQLTQREIEENEVVNKNFLIRSTEMELIMKFIKPSKENEYEDDNNKRLNEDDENKVHFKTATEILIYLNQKSNTNIKLYPANVGKSLKMLGYEQYTKYIKDSGMSLKGYFVKYVNNQSINEDMNNENLENETDIILNETQSTLPF